MKQVHLDNSQQGTALLDYEDAYSDESASFLFIFIINFIFSTIIGKSVHLRASVRVEGRSAIPQERTCRLL